MTHTAPEGAKAIDWAAECERYRRNNSALLEALERSLQYITLAYYDSAGKPDLQQIARRDHELVSAAIAQAKGE